ncbi:MAG: MazG nucleotide pyrophosphohydrolase domain-containing protein [Gammaproteobacteria bacterium]
MSDSPKGWLDAVDPDVPELARATRLQERAASVGFDWNSLAPVLAKVHEELSELEVEIRRHSAEARLQDELGDLLFAVVNLARKLGVSPGTALRGTNVKFARRFAVIEATLAKQGRGPQDASLEEMDAIWEQAKHDEP